MEDDLKNSFLPMIKEDLKSFDNEFNEYDKHDEKEKYDKNNKNDNNTLKYILKKNNHVFFLNSLNTKSIEDFEISNEISNLKIKNQELKKELTVYKNRKIVKFANKINSIIGR
jgi:hypothetical protein